MITENWEDFSKKFSSILDAFKKSYTVPFYERIGLRYIDAYSKEKLNLKEYQWKELIANPWVGVMSIAEEDDLFINSTIDTEYKLNDGISRARIHSGLGVVNNNFKAFIIDSDFMNISNFDDGEINEKMEYLHAEAKKFIESAILPPLSTALEPEEIEL